MHGGFCLFVLGRLHGVTRGRLTAAVAAAGGRLVRQPSAKVTHVALGLGSAPAALGDGTVVRLPPDLPRDVQLLSEMELKHFLRIVQPPPAGRREFGLRDLSRATGVPEPAIRSLSLYGVLQGAEGMFDFDDLRAARAAKRLLDAGFTLPEIVAAAAALRRSGRSLSHTDLFEAPWGEILQQVTGRPARLDGQYMLPLEEAFQSADELFAQAEAREEAGDLEGAERFYARALAADPTDPVLPFNLGNVLHGLGRSREAAIAYQRALDRDRTFAEAWLNLAALHEREGRLPVTEQCLREALKVREDYSDALYSLAHLLTRHERYVEALAVWDRYLDLGPRSAEAAQARRYRSLCRLALSKDAAGSSAIQQRVNHD